MKFALNCALALAAAAVMTGAGREDGRRDGDAPRPAHHSAAPGPATVIKMHRVPVPRPTPIRNPEHVVRDHARIDWPKKDGRGAAIVQPAATTPPAQHAAIVRGAGVVQGIVNQQRVETARNRHYWHEDHGVKYSHYYDGRAHWYGFYNGPSFYWTRYNANRWWWYDQRYARWVYFADGFWWWPGPSGVPYVYVDENYYPYEQEQEGTILVKHPELQTPSAEAPAPNPAGASVSPDGTRMVQLSAGAAEAYLFDHTVAPPVMMKYLGQGVQKVRFSGGTPGAPLQILLEFLDGSFALYDGDGNAKDASGASAAATALPPSDVPSSIPPPPTSAPGH